MVSTSQLSPGHLSWVPLTSCNEPAQQFCIDGAICVEPARMTSYHTTRQYKIRYQRPREFPKAVQKNLFEVPYAFLASSILCRTRVTVLESTCVTGATSAVTEIAFLNQPCLCINKMSYSLSAGITLTGSWTSSTVVQIHDVIVTEMQ